MLPNGDVLVAETNAPPRPEDGKGIKGWFFKRYQKKAGGAVPSANRITLLRDADGDGVAEMRTVFLKDLTRRSAWRWSGRPSTWPTPMPSCGSPISRARRRSRPLRVKVVGPARRAAQPSLDEEPHRQRRTDRSSTSASARTATWRRTASRRKKAAPRSGRSTPRRAVTASSPPACATPWGWPGSPRHGALWAAVNERDELGSDLVPDYMTSVRDGGFYGWPYSYYGQHVDTRVKPPRPDLVAKAIAPDYALGPHTASLGLRLRGGAALPAPFRHGMFVGQHGSWNRKPAQRLQGDLRAVQRTACPPAEPIDVLTGFVRENGDAMGRPVGVAVDKRGGLLVADDVGNSVWRVTSGTGHARASNAPR